MDPRDPVALREATVKLSGSFHRELSRLGFKGETLGMMLSSAGMGRGLRKLIHAFNQEAKKTQLRPSELSDAAHKLAAHLNLRGDEGVAAALLVLKARTAAERNLRRQAREQLAQSESAEEVHFDAHHVVRFDVVQSEGGDLDEE